MHRRLWSAALAVAISVFMPVSGIAAPEPPPVGDLQQSYELLTGTYYTKVDPQILLDGARAALREKLREYGVSAELPALRAQDNTSTINLAELATEIARVQQATRASARAITYAAISGMAHSLGDKYTAFLTPEDYRRFNSALDPDKISGIGVLTIPDPSTGYVQAYYVVPGTPADRAGIQTGDDFTSVDGTSTKGLSREAGVKLLRGNAGSIVRIRISRAGSDLGERSIERTDVQPPTVVFRMLSGNVGYVAILAFGKDTPGEFTTALDRLERDGVRSYVLDLRDNGGGYVNSALDISSKFVSNDPLLTVEERGRGPYTVQAPENVMQRKPIIVLVNRNTASASEITAGALQDDGAGLLLGERTYGKGVMQALTELPDGAAIKITTAHYLTPKNRDINLRGIQPDYSVAENKDAQYGDVNRDAQLRAALEILNRGVANRN